MLSKLEEGGKELFMGGQQNSLSFVGVFFEKMG